MTLAELASGPPLDLVVIGGGINGCAIAEGAAARGLRVALFEAADFGFGTTWRSTKLIHGGLRYLEHGDVRLVFESLRERRWLLKTRPYLVTPQRFLLPMLPWTRRPAWQMKVGLATYDLLALYRGVPTHRRLSRAKLQAKAPYLSGDANGGFSFFDARVHSPERLALEFALSAQRLGAAVYNHAAVTGIHANSGQVEAVSVRHEGAEFIVPARHVVNAAGPWVDAVNKLGDLPGTELLGVTRGTHIVVELDNPPGHDAIFSTAKSDGRVFFAVPQGELLLIGTTDERYDGHPSDIRPVPSDIDYLLAEAQELMPGRAIRREHIRYAYAGLRPLQKVEGGPEAAISRRHAVIDHGKLGGAEGVFSTVGGKLSTFHPLAEEVATLAGAGRTRARVDQQVAPGWRETLLDSGLPKPSLRHLRIYGADIGQVLSLGKEALCEHAGAIEGEVRYVVRNELAVTLADVMMRRTGISWAACRGLCAISRAAAIAAEEAGWDAAETERQVSAFREELDYHLPTEELIVAEPDQHR
ncbi:MAG TPA: glycerol-3-phosphate dehydrogenase/oxidase [Tepidiformaceae bacterium]|nr:glycerol-3-phosphate dehydrogenase/oxidase [Tepidiformaceae bacterium]